MSAKTSPLITTDHPATPRRNGRCSRREFLRSAALGLTAFAAAPLLCGHAAHAALTPYPQEYDAVVEMAKQEQRRNVRPPIAPLQPDPAAYDTLFIGYPNWWGTFPMPVATFLESFPVGNRTLIPFCTHEGSRLGKSEQDLRRFCPQARLLKGFEVRGSRVDGAEPSVKAWLTELGLI